MTELWKDVRVRFMQKVSIPKGPPASVCWEWIAYKNPDGYGQFRFEGSMKRAHRVAWEMANAERVPKGLSVMHSCDNPGCVNPYHLFLGTQRDNMDDMNEKGRGNYVRGERVAQPKLTEPDVLEIRRLVNGGISYRTLGKMFRVTNQAVHSVVSGRTWKHV